MYNDFETFSQVSVGGIGMPRRERTRAARARETRNPIVVG
jgi:hypothetical protein